MQLLAVGLQPFRQLTTLHSENLGSQQSGVQTATDRHRGHRDATRHLHDRMQGVDT